MRFIARRLFLLGAVLAGLAILMAPALAGADKGGADRAFCAPAGLLALGQCSVPGRLDFDFDASSGSLGENPTGTFRFESLPFHIEGQVTCLQVTGNRASVGGTITSGTNFVGMGYAFTVADNTPAAADLISGWPIPDAVRPVAPPANTPNCGDVLQPTNAVTGEIVVQDNSAGQNGKMTVCHKTGNGSSHPLRLSGNAVSAHLRHGDTVGACPPTSAQRTNAAGNPKHNNNHRHGKHK
jgi:hypothetical protein